MGLKPVQVVKNLPKFSEIWEDVPRFPKISEGFRNFRNFDRKGRSADNPDFTSMSCSMGGLTVATEAGVPESILWMQSGHAQLGRAAGRRYVRLTDPDRLYDRCPVTGVFNRTGLCRRIGSQGPELDINLNPNDLSH